MSAATKTSIADSLANGQFKNVIDTLGKAGIVAAGAGQDQQDQQDQNADARRESGTDGVAS